MQRLICMTNFKHLYNLIKTTGDTNVLSYEIKSFQDFSQRFLKGNIEEVLKLDTGFYTSHKQTPDWSYWNNKFNLQKINY